jgi:hypothetical protein
MKRIAVLFCLLALLSAPSPSFALARVVLGNEPISPGLAFGHEVLAAVNTDERVYAFVRWGAGDFYFNGGPKALNEMVRRFAAMTADTREIILLPVPAKPLIHDKKPIADDWRLYVPASRGAGLEFDETDTRATLTIYIPEARPPAPADTKQVKGWIADLGSDDFKTRERAAKELAAIGPPVAALLREALASRTSAEARDRMERILAGASPDIQLDVLRLPEGVSVIGLDGLLARSRSQIADKDPAVRAQGALHLITHGAPAEEVLPDLEKMLKTETLTDPLAGAAWAAYRLGAGARPLLPTLRTIAKTTDKELARICGQAIENIEMATVETVSDAEVKRRAVIRKEIHDFVAGLPKKP